MLDIISAEIYDPTSLSQAQLHGRLDVVS